MPPRYAYWTILVDEQPTAFRAASQEDLMPTFKRLMQKHPSAKMVWFQNGKIWPSRVDAQEHMRFRGERSREVQSERNRSGDFKGHGDTRQGGGFRDRQRSSRPQDFKTSRPQDVKTSEKLEWKPKGEFTPAPKRDGRSDWKPKASFDRERKPDWKPKGSFDRERKPDWKPRGDRSSKPQGLKSSRPEWAPKGERRQASGKLVWTPKGAGPTSEAPKRKWIPKAEYKKSQGIEAPRDKKWRPGGEHRDPKQKYKDAKKAKWGRFKQTIRKRWDSKQGRPPGRKKRDEE